MLAPSFSFVRWTCFRWDSRWHRESSHRISGCDCWGHGEHLSGLSDTPINHLPIALPSGGMLGTEEALGGSCYHWASPLSAEFAFVGFFVVISGSHRLSGCEFWDRGEHLSGLSDTPINRHPIEFPSRGMLGTRSKPLAEGFVISRENRDARCLGHFFFVTCTLFSTAAGHTKRKKT